MEYVFAGEKSKYSVLGLDASIKITLLYRLKANQTNETNTAYFFGKTYPYIIAYYYYYFYKIPLTSQCYAPCMCTFTTGYKKIITTNY